MENILEQFRKLAPSITKNVKARIIGNESEEEILMIIHQEIIHFFNSCKNMFMQYITFDENQRRDFAEIMYTLLAPMAEGFKDKANSEYVKFQNETGKSGSLNFICYKLEQSHAS
jgi:hypothetical protein